VAGAPQKLGKYEIVRQLGIGGMAEVFEARLPGVAGFSKTVVIKRILPHLAKQKAFVNMFVREAKIAAAVHHRNVVQVFELDQTEEGELFLVMEMIKGIDLRHVLGQASRAKLRVPPWFSAYCVAEVLDGLAYAHGITDELGRPRNLVHRDVTPSNIFVSHLGEVKLGDFGVARDDLLDSQTQTGQFKGKVAYMAPEQLYGKNLDGRVDVFAAGVVLWECLTQKRLFGGRQQIETMNAIVKEPRIPPSRKKGDVPKELDDIVLAALQPDPAQRLPSAKVFRARLLDVLRKHGSVLGDDVRSVVEVLEGKRDQSDILEPSGSSSGPSFSSASSAAEFSDVSEGGLITSPGGPDIPADPAPPPRSRSTADLPAGVKVMVGKKEPPKDEMDMEALVNEAVASVSQDLVKPGVEVIPQDSLLAGLDRRKHSAHLSDAARQRWASYGVDKLYEGPHPFWLKDHDGQEIGPVGYEQAQQIFKMEAYARLSGESSISGDQGRWISMTRYSEITGQPMYVRADEDAKPDASKLIGTIEERPVLPTLTALGQAHASGRLMVVLEGHRRYEIRELDLHEGRPCATYANHETLQLIPLLTSKRLLPEGLVPELVRKAVILDRPLFDIASAQLATSFEAYRSAIEKERLTDAFSWESGGIYFDPDAPPRAAPFASSVLQIVAPIVLRLDPALLKQRIAPYLETVLKPMGSYAAAVAELQLTEPQREAVELLAKGKRISGLSKLHPEKEKTVVAVAYMLLGIGAIAP
jgi:serine/threonine protein kinase